MDGCIYRTKDGECDLYADGGKYHAFCVGDAPCDGRKQSNADKIRQMSDEELAEWMAKIMYCAECMFFNDDNGTCNYEQRYVKGCNGAMLDWLKQEVRTP